MEIKTVWGVFFSATGTTEKVVTGVAKTLAKLNNAECKFYSFNLPEARTRKLTFSKEDLVILGIPVYAGRVPNLLSPFIREKVFGNATLATPITLFGNRSYDDALIELRNIMQKNGFCPVSAGAFVGEHSFSTILGAGRPDADDMALADQLAQETAKIVRSISAPPTEAVSVRGNEPVGPFYVPRDRSGNPLNILKAKPKTDTAKCLDCGLCRNICPMGSIDPANVGEIPGVCIKCGACIKKCPAQAKYFDDKGYLYHRQDLEYTYSRRAGVELFY